jgi:hypothetical protein
VSVASKKRRRVKRHHAREWRHVDGLALFVNRAKRLGGDLMLEELARLAAKFPPPRLDQMTPDQRFADAVARGWPVYAHPDTAGAAREAGLVVHEDPRMERGKLFAVKPAPPLVGLR